MGQRKRQSEAVSESPVAWFAALERARQTDDYKLAHRADAELRRLGIVVRFGRKAKHTTPSLRKEAQL